MNKRVNVNYSIAMDDGTFIEDGRAVVELWNGNVILSDFSKEKKEKIEDMLSNGYNVGSRSISFVAGDKNPTTVVYDLNEDSNGCFSISEEKRQELIGWIKTFPDSFTSPDAPISSLLGAENVSEPVPTNETRTNPSC